jgi:anti-anti-sigma regulatory factor
MTGRLEVERWGPVKGYAVLCFKGPVTVENVSVFLSAVKRKESFQEFLISSDVPYIDSSALGVLVSAYVSRQKLG